MLIYITLSKWKPIKFAKDLQQIIGTWEGTQRIITGYIDGDKFRSETTFFPRPTHFMKLPKPLKSATK